MKYLRECTQALGLLERTTAKAHITAMTRNRIIMVYPRQGFSGLYVRHVPLSLLYASAEVVKKGYDVEIFDVRLFPQNWERELEKRLGPDVLAVGVSVMSGAPIMNAREIGRLVKSKYSEIAVIWGGPHATFHPESILNEEPSADFVISGYGAKPFSQLISAVAQGGDLGIIDGLTWRDCEKVQANGGNDTAFEFMDYKDIPYDLIPNYSAYGQLDQDRLVFSMYSAMGCPYQCAFCSSPAQYKPIPGKKWVPIEAKQVVDHVEYVVDKYQANYIYFIDDDSFPKLDHVEGIIDEIKRRRIKVQLGFRGARINEIKKMSHEFLSKLARAGTDILHIGAECGSDRMLKLMGKNCTVDDILECNRKLAKHPEITAAYNFIMGLPTETLEDLKGTRDMMMQLVDDHPNCLIFPPNKFRPLPGTELYTVAKEEWGYEMPTTLDAWTNIEVEGDISSEWYSKSFQRFCNLLLISAYFVDNKVARVTSGKTLFYKFIRLINLLYRPIARFRLRYGLSAFLVEYYLYRWLSRLMVYFQQTKKKSTKVG